jgi:hypothetical protein
LFLKARLFKVSWPGRLEVHSTPMENTIKKKEFFNKIPYCNNKYLDSCKDKKFKRIKLDKFFDFWYQLASISE